MKSKHSGNMKFFEEGLEETFFQESFFQKQLFRQSPRCGSSKDLRYSFCIIIFAGERVSILKALGRHFLAELSGCRHEILTDVDKIRKIITQAAKEASAEVREVAVHRFSPQGISGVVVIAESHLSIHTWPEYNYAAIDIFTCGENTKPENACNFITWQLEASTQKIIIIERGIEQKEGIFEQRIVSGLSEEKVEVF